MSYCSVDDIRADFKDIVFNTTSSVTELEVEKFIEEETAFIDSMICSGIGLGRCALFLRASLRLISKNFSKT